MQEGASDAVEQKNAVRAMLRSFFPERDCYTLVTRAHPLTRPAPRTAVVTGAVAVQVRPVADEAQLAELSSLPRSALRPEFRAQVDAIRKRVWTTAKPKTLYGYDVNGAGLAELVVAYCQAFNEHGTPTIASAWDRVVGRQCDAAVAKAVAEYAKRAGQLVDGLARRVSPENPSAAVLESAEVAEVNRQAVAVAVSAFNKQAVRVSTTV